MAGILSVTTTLAVIFREPIAALLSGTEVVKSQVLGVFLVMLLMTALDSMQTTIDGILRGLGKQALVFKIKICCMWAIRLPSACLGVFLLSSGIRGLWWASSCGPCVCRA